ncbi:MAG: 30S ribosomal protein S20 [Chloroflexota bacterium]|nr:30S ribosomal protein S20 [Chloroflexota bacterium]
MAHSKSAKKSIRIIEERRIRNRAINSSVKTRITRAEKLIRSGEAEAASTAVREATIALDRAAQRGVIHSNNAARRKSRLMKKLNATFSSR